MDSPLSSVIFVLNLLSIVGAAHTGVLFTYKIKKKKNAEIINE